jgi:HEAT repeat protein
MQIVPFDVQDRLLAQAKGYIANPGLMLFEKEKAVPLLLRALRIGDIELRREILLLLGSFAKEQVYWPLYEIMSDPQEPEEVRDQAAIHLSVIGAFLDDPQGLVRKLISDLDTADNATRVRAIMSLGWEGNLAAILPLIECLYDPDLEIQEVAVTALCNLRDSRVVRLLADRMRHCSVDQKRSILFNLWRFKDKQEEVRNLYRKELESGDDTMRLDILVLIGQLDDQVRHEDLYRRFVNDPDPRIRALALERLGTMGSIDPDDVLPFLNDSSMDVKRVAINILQEYKGH